MNNTLIESKSFYEFNEEETYEVLGGSSMFDPRQAAGFELLRKAAEIVVDAAIKGGSYVVGHTVGFYNELYK